jgi:hypothetical protein
MGLPDLSFIVLFRQIEHRTRLYAPAALKNKTFEIP